MVLPVPAMESQIGMIERGEADLFGWTMDATQGKRLAQNPDIGVVQAATHGLHEIRFNLAMPPLENPASGSRSSTRRIGRNISTSFFRALERWVTTR